MFLNRERVQDSYSDPTSLVRESVLSKISDRQQSSGQNNGGDQIEDRDAGPHQGSGALLVRKRREREPPGGVEVHRVNDTVAKCKVGGKDVARKRGKKKVKQDGPARPVGDAWPGLNHGPPEKESSDQETGVLDNMPGFRLQAERKGVGDMPSH